MSSETRFLIGAIGLSIPAFLLPLYFGNIWLGYFLVFFISILFLGSLIRFAGEKLESKLSKRMVIGVTGILIVCQIISFAHDFSRKDFQREVLLEIRKTIDTGIIKNDVQRTLTYVFAQYHETEGSSIVETVREVIPQKLGEEGVFISENDVRENSEDDNLNYFYELDEASDEFRVIIVADIPIGEQRAFQNYDGQTGKYELLYTLSEEGVKYEIRN